MRVAVYFNLHLKQFSIRAEEGPAKGRVIAHAERVHLLECTLSVGQAGNAKVRREGRKNVHAYIRGHLSAFDGTVTVAGLGLHLPCAGQGTIHPANLDAYLRERFNLTKADGVSITYDPYRDTSFVVPEVSRLPVRGAWSISLDNKRGVYGVGVTA